MLDHRLVVETAGDDLRRAASDKARSAWRGLLRLLFAGEYRDLLGVLVLLVGPLRHQADAGLSLGELCTVGRLLLIQLADSSALWLIPGPLIVWAVSVLG